MGRHTGAKARVNRRLKFQVYENAGAVRAFERKSTPPGMATKRGKQSDFGVAFSEKQKIKFYYGLREAQLRRYFEMAKRQPGNTGAYLLILCERRLDNVIRRAGFTNTRPQARQGITHGHFQVNGKTVDRPSMLMKPGDVITVRPRPNLKTVYADMAKATTKVPCNWVSFDADDLRATVLSMPNYEDVSLPVEVGQVVAFLQR